MATPVTIPYGEAAAGALLRHWGLIMAYAKRHLAARLLDRFHSLLLGSFDVALRHPRRVCTGFTALILLLIPFSSQLHFYISPDDMIGDSFVSITKYKEMRDEFDLDETLQLNFFNKNRDSLDADDICAINNAVINLSFRNLDIKEISSPLLLRKSSWDGRLFTFPELFSDPCAQKEKRFDLAPLGQTPFWPLFTGLQRRDLTYEVNLRKASKGALLGDFDPGMIDPLIAAVRAELENARPSVDLTVTGYSFYKQGMFKGLMGQNLLNLLLMALFCIIMRVFFGRWLAGGVLLFTLAVMAGMLYGFMGLIGLPSDLLSAGLFMIVTLAAAQDVLFLSYQMLKSTGPWQPVFRNYLLPSFLTSLTTIVGFGSLCVSDLETIRRFGCLAALGALLEWLITFYYLPSILHFWPRITSWVDPRRALDLGRFWRMAAFVPARGLVILLVGLFLLSPLTIFMLKINDSPELTFPPSHAVTLGYDYLRHSRKWINQSYLVFADAQRETENRAVLARLRANPHVVHINDPYEFIDFFARPASADMRPMVKASLAAASAFHRHFSPKNRALATIYSDSYEMAHTDRMVALALNLCPQGECELLGPAISYNEFSARVIPTLVESLMVCLLLIVGILGFLCRATAVAHPFKIIFSSLWGSVSVIGVLKVLNLDVNYVVCIFASVLVGIAGDNAIQFMFSPERHDQNINGGIDDKGAGALQISLITMMMSFIFMLSDFRALRTLGVLFAIGIGMALIGDLWLLRGLLRRNSCPNPP